MIKEGYNKHETKHEYDNDNNISQMKGYFLFLRKL